VPFLVVAGEVEPTTHLSQHPQRQRSARSFAYAAAHSGASAFRCCQACSAPHVLMDREAKLPS
jgi:hypothetical protein